MEKYEADVSPRFKSMLSKDWSYLELANATRMRQAMYASASEFFRRYDAFVTPTVPFTALPLGAEGPESFDCSRGGEAARAIIGFCYPSTSQEIPPRASHAGRYRGSSHWDADRCGLESR